MSLEKLTKHLRHLLTLYAVVMLLKCAKEAAGYEHEAKRKKEERTELNRQGGSRFYASNKTKPLLFK